MGYPLPQILANAPLILKVRMSGTTLRCSRGCTDSIKLLLVMEFIYATSLTTIKLSVLCFYLRIFVSKGMRRTTKCALVLAFCWIITNFIQVFLICSPFAASYDPTVPGQCGDQFDSYVAIGTVNIIMEIFIVLLPVRTIMRLQMKRTQKAGLIILLTMGLS